MQNDTLARKSLERADLWDLRPIEEFQRPEIRFTLVVEQATKGDSGLVQVLTIRSEKRGVKVVEPFGEKQHLFLRDVNRAQQQRASWNSI